MSYRNTVSTLVANFPVADEHADCAACAAGETSEHNPEPEPETRTYQVFVPVIGEVIFTVEADSEREAALIANDIDWIDGEMNIEQDDNHDVTVEDIG